LSFLKSFFSLPSLKREKKMFGLFSSASDDDEERRVAERLVIRHAYGYVRVDKVIVGQRLRGLRYYLQPERGVASLLLPADNVGSRRQYLGYLREAERVFDVRRIEASVLCILDALTFVMSSQHDANGNYNGSSRSASAGDSSLHSMSLSAGALFSADRKNSRSDDANNDNNNQNHHHRDDSSIDESMRLASDTLLLAMQRLSCRLRCLYASAAGVCSLLRGSLGFGKRRASKLPTFAEAMGYFEAAEGYATLRRKTSTSFRGFTRRLFEADQRRTAADGVARKDSVAWDHNMVQASPYLDASPVVLPALVAGDRVEQRRYMNMHAPKSERHAALFYAALVAHRVPVLVTLAEQWERSGDAFLFYPIASPSASRPPWMHFDADGVCQVHVELVDNDECDHHVGGDPLDVEYMTVRRLHVKVIDLRKGVSVSHDITQFHYRNWEDRALPQPHIMRTLVALVSDELTRHRWSEHKVATERGTMTIADSPICAVHCQSGVGRTGVFILIHALGSLVHRRANFTVDVLSTWTLLRLLRDCVQGPAQLSYVFGFLRCIGCAVDKREAARMRAGSGPSSPPSRSSSSSSSMFDMDIDVTPLAADIGLVPAAYPLSENRPRLAAFFDQSGVLPRPGHLEHRVQYNQWLEEEGVRMGELLFERLPAPFVDNLVGRLGKSHARVHEWIHRLYVDRIALADAAAQVHRRRKQHSPGDDGRSLFQMLLVGDFDSADRQLSEFFARRAAALPPGCWIDRNVLDVFGSDARVASNAITSSDGDALKKVLADALENTDSALFTCALSGDADAFAAALGSDDAAAPSHRIVDAQFGQTLLHKLAVTEHVTLVVDVLLARCGHAREQLNARDACSLTPLHWAVVANRLDMFRALLAALLSNSDGDDESTDNICEALRLAALYGRRAMGAALLALEQCRNVRFDGERMYFRAVGRVEHSMVLKDATPLANAALNGHVDMCAMLLAKSTGTDGSASSLPVTANGMSPLHLACYSSTRAKCVQLLIDAAAERDAVNEPTGNVAKLSPLHIAAMHGAIESAALLLAAGACVRAVDALQCTSLHRAAEHGHLDILRLLVGHGASVHALNGNRQTPVDVADSHGHAPCCDYLLSQGAKPPSLWKAAVVEPSSRNRRQIASSSSSSSQ
jgi:ankyrin repeat protein/protein tyrosine phosphatase